MSSHSQMPFRDPSEQLPQAMDIGPSVLLPQTTLSRGGSRSGGAQNLSEQSVSADSVRRIMNHDRAVLVAINLHSFLTNSVLWKMHKCTSDKWPEQALCSGEALSPPDPDANMPPELLRGLSSSSGPPSLSSRGTQWAKAHGESHAASLDAAPVAQERSAAPAHRRCTASARGPSRSFRRRTRRGAFREKSNH